MSRTRTRPAGEPRKPPLPTSWYAIVNPPISALLSSPLHALLSRVMITITFTGRTSGRRITTPVAYSRQGETLFVLAKGPWWRNLRGGAPVTVWLKGLERRGHANATDDPAELLPFPRRRLAEIGGIKYARRADLADRVVAQARHTDASQPITTNRAKPSHAPVGHRPGKAPQFPLSIAIDI